jgi:dTDP-4-dehydrorhamnose reductase
MRILLLGKTGQLGWELQRSLAPLGEVIALSRQDLDICDLGRVRACIREIQPDLIVNAAAYTAVDRAEKDTETAHMVNALAPGALAEEAAQCGAVLIHFSTDYVFDGAKRSPYFEEDPPNPLNVYGQSKLEGERAVREAGCIYLILRTSWLYSLRRDNFVTHVLDWVRTQRTVRVVEDQYGSPTWCRLLAEATTAAISPSALYGQEWLSERVGVYHVACQGSVSRHEWVRAISKYDPSPEEHILEKIEPVPFDAFPTPATRPRYSALDCSRFAERFGLLLPDWEVALQSAMDGAANDTPPS